MKRIFMMVVRKILISFFFFGLNQENWAMDMEQNKLTVINSEKLDKEYQEEIVKMAEKYNLITLHSGKYIIKAQDLVESCVETAEKIDDPEIFKKQFNQTKIKFHQNIPTGVYAMAEVCPIWIQSPIEVNAPYGQGLKVHVSAKPETALKVVKIVLPILEEKKVSYKVMYDLPIMRGTYYLSQYENSSYLIGENKSTQAGKFIVFYPDSVESAQEIIQEIEKKFTEHKLTSDDFVRVEGDAQIGKSGGIFARYGKTIHKLIIDKGNLDNNHIHPLNPQEKIISKEMMIKAGHEKYDPSQGILDERKYPWPDYMNNRDLFDKPLFGELDVIWVNPNNPEEVISWDKRPKSWDVLQN